MKKRILSALLVIAMLCTMLPQISLEAKAHSVVMTADEFIGYLQYVVDRKDSKYGSGDQYSIGKYEGNRIYFDCWGLGESIICTKGEIVYNRNTSLNPWNLWDKSCGCGSYSGDYLKTLCQLSTDFTDMVPGEWLFKDDSSGHCYHVGYYIGNGKVIESTSDGSYNTQVSTIDSNGRSNLRGSSWTWTSHGKVPWIDYNPCEHEKHYEGVGVCSNCGYVFNWESTFDPSAAGVYKIAKSFTPRTDKPYKDATEANFCTIPGAEVNVLGSYTNAYENKWYVYESNGEKYYVYEDYLTFVGYGEQEISCTITSPKEGATVPRESYPVAGTVTSKYPIQKIEAYIDGKWYATVTLGSQTTLDIRTSKINYDLDFATLDPGSHSLVLKAHDIHHDTLELIIRRNFVTEGEAACTHSYNSSVTAPTCTAQGYTTYTCDSCGYSYTDNYTDMKEHSYGDWTTVTAATCTADGTEKRTCSACGKAAERTVNAYGHWYLDSVTQPSCTDQGYTTHVCANCGDSYVDSYEDALNHNYESKVIDATCVEYAKIQYTCTRCGHSYMDTAGDGYSAWSTTKPVGVDESLIESRTEYSYRTKEFVTSPSDTMNGWTLYDTSTQWGEYGTWSDWSDASVTEDDFTKVETRTVYEYYYYKCSSCGAHMHGWNITCPTWAGGCGKAKINSGDYVEVWSTTSYDNANLKDFHGTGKYYTTIDGERVFRHSDQKQQTQYRYCTRHQETTYHYYKWSDWSDWTTEKIWIADNQEVATRMVYRYAEAELGEHKYIGEVFEPTCTQQGYTKYTCEYCGDWYCDDYIVVREHEYHYVVTLEPTVDVEGTLTGTCTSCGDVAIMKLPKLNKTDYTYEVTKQPTSSKTGTGRYTWKTTDCGIFSFDLTLDKLPAVMYGDVDGNGRIQTNDAKLILQYIVKIVDNLDKNVADVDGNGRIQTNDAKLILQYIVKIISEFPVETKA